MSCGTAGSAFSLMVTAAVVCGVKTSRMPEPHLLARTRSRTWALMSMNSIFCVLLSSMVCVVAHASSPCFFSPKTIAWKVSICTPLFHSSAASPALRQP